MIPFNLPANPKLTMRQVLAWMSKKGGLVSAGEVSAHFQVTMSDACVRIMRLHRQGYLRKSRQEVNRYEPTTFGRTALRRWGKS